MKLLPLPDRWDAGLREDIEGREPPNAAVVARNVEFNTTFGPTKRTGFVKVSKVLPAAAALRLDGFHTCGVIDESASGGQFVNLQAPPWTMMIEFALRVPETGADEPGTYLWEFSEGPFLNTQLFVYIASRADGTYRLRALASNAAGDTTVNPLSEVELRLNTVYRAGIRYGQETGSESETLGVRIIGEEDWQESGVLGGNLYNPSSAETDIHVHLGAKGRQVANLNDGEAVSRMQRVGQVDFHRIRIWDDYLDDDFSADPDVDYLFDDMTSLRISDRQGNAPDVRIVETGQNEFGAGVDVIPHRPFVQWETAAPLVGNGSLSFDGYTQYLRITNAFRYRKSLLNYEDLSEDEDLPEFDELQSYGFSVVVSFDTLARDMGIVHMTRTRSTKIDARPGGSGGLYFALWLDADGDPNGPRIRFSYGTGVATDESIETDPSIYALATDRTYLILATRDIVEGTTTLRITADPDTWEHEVENASASTGQLPPTEGSKFDDRKSKYAFILGSIIRATQFQTNRQNPDDPDDFRLFIHYRRMFKGKMDSFCFYSMERETGGSGTLPKGFVLQQLTKNLTQEAITSIATQFRVLSAYFFEEGMRDFTIDRGLLGNHIRFITDPDRLYVRNQADGLGIADAAPSSIDALAEQRDPIFGRKIVALAGPALYTVDPENETIEVVGEGVRNDTGAQAHINRYDDDIIICTDGSHKPWRYTGDALFPLGVERLRTDRVRYGLVMQGYERGAMAEGVRRYRVVYYSSITNEEGDWDSEIVVKIPPKQTNANVAFGATSTDNTTSEGIAIKVRPNQRAASVQSVTAGPYDLTDGSPDTWIAAKLNVLVTGGGPGKESAFSTTEQVSIDISDVDDPENVSARELADVLDRKLEGVRVFPVAGGRHIRFLGVYLGRVTDAVTSSIQFADQAVNADETDLFEILGFSSPLESGFGEDSGNSQEALPVPMASPQVTHIRFYRTTADGSVFHIAGEVPIGDTPEGYTQGRYWVDDVSDDDLVFRPVMDERKGEPPKASMSLTVGARVVYAGDEDNPERLYWSVPGHPDIVEPFNFADILGGGELEITALSFYAGLAYIHKERATYVLAPVSSPAIPFNIQLRKPDVGCSSRFGIAKTGNSIYVSDPLYPRMFDSMTYRDPGYYIRRSWQGDITDAQSRTIVAIHRSEDRQVWFALPDGDTYVYHYAKDAWSKYTNLRIRCMSEVLADDRVETVYFGDEWGNIFQFKASVHNDGGNFITDAGEINESLTGTGFVVAGTTITLTGFTVTESQSELIRGLKLHLEDDGTEDEVRALYVDGSGNIVVDATTAFSDDTYASGVWTWCRIDAEYQSGEIETPGNVMRVKHYGMSFEALSGWPQGHTVQMLAVLLAGVTTRGELQKEIFVSDDRALLGFPFQARSFRWGVRNESPDEPFSVSTMAIAGDIEDRRGRPF